MSQFIRQHWAALLAILPFLPTLWRELIRLLDWGARVDLIANKLHEAGGVSGVLAFLINPPPWLIWPALAVAVVLLLWDARRNRLAATQVAVESAPRAPVTASSPQNIVGTEGATRRGDILITLGQSIIIAASIAATVGVLVGLALILIGQRQNENQRSEAIKAAIAAGEKVERLIADSPQVAAPRVETPAPVAPVATAPAATPEPAIPKAPEKPRREYVGADVTPEFLVGLYDTNTMLGAQTIVSKNYVGKWMVVSGPLMEVFGGRALGGDNTPAVAAFARQKGPSILMVFKGESIGRLSTIAKNQIMIVHGQIREVERSKIELDNCEIVDSDPATNAPARPPDSPTRPRRRRPPKVKRPPT